MKKILTLLLIICLIVVIVIKYPKKDTITKIDNIIEEKQTKIIFIYNGNSNQCAYCVETKIDFEYYQNQYKLNSIDIEFNKLTEKQKSSITKKLNLDENAKNMVTIIYIKDGENIASTFGELDSKSILESLHEQKYISDNDYNTELKELDTDIFTQNDELLVLLAINSKETNDYKIIVKNQAKLNDLKYKYIDLGLAVNYEVKNKIYEQLDDYETPMIILIKNQKIQKSTKIITENSIKNMLKE